jgi:hypothetical protein
VPAFGEQPAALGSFWRQRLGIYPANDLLELVVRRVAACWRIGTLAGGALGGCERIFRLNIMLTHKNHPFSKSAGRNVFAGNKETVKL